MKKIYNVTIMLEIDDDYVEHDAELLGLVFTESTKTLLMNDPPLRRGVGIEDLIVMPVSCDTGEWTQQSAKIWQATEDDPGVLLWPGDDIAGTPRVITGTVWGFDPGVN